MAFGLGGENVGRAFVSLHANGDDVPDDIGDALDKLTPKFKEAGVEHSKEYSDWFEREAKKNSRKSADAFLGGFRDELGKGIKDFDKTKTAAQQLEQGLKRLKAISEDNDRVTRHWLDRFHRQLVTVNGALDESATKVGKMFGKGSRNDFVNIIGASIEGLSRLIGIAPKAAEKISGVFSGKGSGGGMDLVKVATQVGTSIVGIVIGLVGLVTVAGAAATLINGIAAALIGLAASAAFAAGAVGGVALALSGPLVLGIGVAMLALANLDDRTKKAFDGIGDSFSKLGDSAGKAIGPGLRAAAENLRPAIGKLKPVIDAVAESLGGVAEGWSKALDGDTFARFRHQLEVFAPDAIEALGKAAGNVAGGLSGVFRSAIPVARDFLDWLVRVTDKFDEWANSRKGQQQLREFFEKAADSAESIGGFIDDATVAIAKLFDKGKDSGDSLFEKASKQLRKFTDYITDPENQDAIKDFFDNGVDVAEKLGNAILDISNALDKLDTPESREFLTFLFDGFGVILELVIRLSEAFTKGRSAFNKMVHAISEGSSLISSAVRGTFRKAGQVISNFFQGAYSESKEVWHKMAAGASSAASSIGGFFRRLGTAIGNFFQGAYQEANQVWNKMASGASRVVSAITGFFRALPGKVGNAVQGVVTAVTRVFNLVLSNVRGIPGLIVDAFRGLAGQILGAIGSIDIGSLIHIPDSIGGFHLPSLAGLATATGGIFGGAQVRVIGEAGREAVVPLDRPLSQVDPSVRGLSAIAQGAGVGKSIDASGWTVVTSGPDPHAVAVQVVNEFAAKALY